MFGLRYGGRYEKHLAIGDEDGYISIINTGKALTTSLDDDSSSNRAVAQWSAHNNAVFDLAWCNGDAWMYTASGDMSIALWDTHFAGKLAKLQGHTGSVKCLSVSPLTPTVLASGARDGALLIWDVRVPPNCCARVPGSSNVRHPVLRVSSPHTPHCDSKPSSTKSSRRQKTFLQGRHPPSVTALQFLNAGSGHVLVSGGVDGLVKFWDLRHTGQPATKVAPPQTGAGEVNNTLEEEGSKLEHLVDGTRPSLGQRMHAITCLALRPLWHSELLVSLTGGHHLLYDVNRPDKGPLQWYGGHTVSSFYVKSTWSPDGSHFASGSSDAGVYIWQADHRDGASAPYVLHGHEKEVTAAAWCPADDCELATAADDYTIKVWHVHQQQDAEVPEPPRTWDPVKAGQLVSSWTHDREEYSRTTPDGRGVAPIVTPAPRAAVTDGAVQATPAPRRMTISNALLESVRRELNRKRTRQQTLAEALRAVRPACGKAQQDGNDGEKRPRVASADSSQEYAERHQPDHISWGSRENVHPNRRQW